MVAKQLIPIKGKRGGFTLRKAEIRVCLVSFCLSQVKSQDRKAGDVLTLVAGRQAARLIAAWTNRCCNLLHPTVHPSQISDASTQGGHVAHIAGDGGCGKGEEGGRGLL